MWCIPPEQDAAFVAAMEQVLAVYHRAYNPLYPVVNMDEAFRILSRIELVFTPKHGSWLNMAEPELSVMTRQCFADRVATQAEVAMRTAAWQLDRNKRQIGINWQFSTADAGSN